MYEVVAEGLGADFYAERPTSFTEDLASHPLGIALLEEMEASRERIRASESSSWTPEKLTAWCGSIEVRAWQELAHRWNRDRLSFAEAEVVVRDVAEDRCRARGDRDGTRSSGHQVPQAC